MANIMRGLLPLFAAGGAAATLSLDEAEAAVYSKDGRRLLNLLDNASKGALPTNEPVFEFQERLPKDIFKAAKEDNDAFHTRSLAADRNDIQHYWNARRGHMSNEEIEDLVESLTTGQDRFYVRANKPYAESVGALGSSTGGRGALRPSEEFTYLHQVNPLSNKRLLKMKSRSWETPDGSAFHPDTSHSPEGGATQRAFSADGVSDDSNIPAIETIRKGMLPLFAGGTAAALAPGEASASVSAEQYRWPADEPGYVNREPGLGTPLVDVADLAVAPIGAATAAGRAASVAAEPFISYGMDKAGNWLGDKIGGLLGYFGWGE